MKALKARKRTAAVCTLLLLAGAIAGLAPVAQAGAQSKSGAGRATFDLYSMFPEQPLSPMTGKLKTFMPLQAREISSSGEVALSVSTESSHFTAKVDPVKVTPAKGKPAEARVYVECFKGTPDGEIGWVKVTGSRGGESHRIWLKATTTSSSPTLEMSRGLPLVGPGHLDPVLQAYTGKPLVWHVAAKNEGGEADTYSLESNASFPCSVVYRNARGDVVRQVKLEGRTRNLLFSKPAELTAELRPTGNLPVRQPQEVTLTLGPGKRGAALAQLKVQVLNPGLVYCANDLAGPSPHAHQVMPGETTTFMFHLTNSGSTTETVKVDVAAAAGDAAAWKVGKDAQVVTLKPGRTGQVTVYATAPVGSVKGERLELVATADSSTGLKDSARVAAEVTDQRNIYYWSIDSMDPEYLYLDRKGTGAGKDGDRLMPNIYSFLKEGANYTDARSYLPSATDMNHTNALAGTYSGTAGVYMVGGTYHGFNEHDEVTVGPNDLKYAKYGPDGTPIQRSFEVAKEQTGGKALCGFWSNKNWLAELEGKGIDIVGHSERWPLFFEPPYKYAAAGDPRTDTDPGERSAPSVRAVFHSNNASAVIVPTVLGDFDIITGIKLLSTPFSILFGKTPGMHAEDRYIADSFFRSIKEQDPDVSYVNIGDLDNTGHFTGAGYPTDEWKTAGDSPVSDVNIYSPYMRRDDSFDICREADVLFGQFVDLLKQRGVYDNSVIVFLSDHGMENMKDPKDGYKVIDLRQILHDQGYLRHEDYEETGGTEINVLWTKNPSKTADMVKALKDFTIDDPKLGTVHPLTVIDRAEMESGVDYGDKGHVAARELMSEYWQAHPDQGMDGEMWPDIFVFPLYNYQVVGHGDVLTSGVNAIGFSLGIHIPETVLWGLPGAHGGLQTDHIPLVFKPPAGYAKYQPGTEHKGEVEIGDIAPTIYGIMGWPVPGCVDGKPLP